MIEIREVGNKSGLKEFIKVQFDIYKNDKNWVPPIKGQVLKTLEGKNNPLFTNGIHTFFIAYKDNEPVGRILAGINNKLNTKKMKKEGYISLFESIDDDSVAYALFDRAILWVKQNGMDSIVGPVSPTNGDDSRGVLIQGFDGPPTIMNSYNRPYYGRFFENYGFEKDMDLFAYHLDTESMDEEKFGRVVEYAMKRYNFHIDKFNKRQVEREVKDIKVILDLAMPESWGHLTPPSLEDLRAEVNALKKFMDVDLVYIARSGNEPIGFVVAIPDYNQVIRKLNGSLLPFGFLKYLWYRRKINGARIFIQFVVPRFRNKAVNSAIYHKLMMEARKKGYIYGEGSTIAEMNKESIRNVEGAGGKLYRVYRIYRKLI